MNTLDFQNKLISYIEQQLECKILTTSVPPQGMSSKVFFITTTNREEYAVKYGNDAMNDVPAFELIQNEKVKLPIPKLIKAFTFEDIQVVVMERIKYQLLDSIPVEQIAKYIPSMIETQKVIHSIKSNKPGLIIETDSTKTWKEMMLNIFEDKDFDWEEVSNREGLDKNLILHSVKKITKKINSLNFDYNEYSLLHTDYNQRNLFVDPSTNQITGIIDWEEAMFGDPIYDFSRIRMLIWHYDLGEDAINNYYDLLQYSNAERELDNLYWLSRVIQYLGWYSEELNEFNLGRINLHQEFLRNYDWD